MHLLTDEHELYHITYILILKITVFQEFFIDNYDLCIFVSNMHSCFVHRLQDDTSAARYISEIVVKLQPVDLVFSALTLSSFVTVLYPVLMLSEHKQIYTHKTTGTTTNWTMHINNNTLPLLYLDTCNIRIILPASELTAVGDLHDVCLLQVEAVSLTPQVSFLLRSQPELSHVITENCRQGVGEQ